jgi:hypothetical protein
MNLAPAFGTDVSSLPPKGAAHCAWGGPALRVVAPTFGTHVQAL